MRWMIRYRSISQENKSYEAKRENLSWQQVKLKPLTVVLPRRHPSSWAKRGTCVSGLWKNRAKPVSWTTNFKSGLKVDLENGRKVVLATTLQRKLNRFQLVTSERIKEGFNNKLFPPEYGLFYKLFLKDMVSFFFLIYITVKPQKQHWTFGRTRKLEMVF